jgi:beta-glucosidase
VPLGDAAFRHWDVATGAWQVERGTWSVLAGAHVDDLPVSVEVEVTGTVGPRTEKLPARYRTGDVRGVPDADFAALLGRPVPHATLAGPLSVNDALDRMGEARSLLARLVHRVLTARRVAAERRGKADLNILFVLNMPFRAIGKMTNGAVSAEMVDGIIDIVNGHFLRGVGATVRALLRNRRANRATDRALRGDA